MLPSDCVICHIQVFTFADVIFMFYYVNDILFFYVQLITYLILYGRLDNNWNNISFFGKLHTGICFFFQRSGKNVCYLLTFR